MKGLRFWIIIILGWFFLLYNVERLSEPINVASFVYILTLVLGVLIILLPSVQKISSLWLLIMPLPVFFVLKVWLGYPIGGKNLPVTVTEICALGLTTLLAQQVGRQLEEFREAASDAMLKHLKNLSHSFEVGQGQMYSEVRWARQYARPLALLAIAAPDKLPEQVINRFIEEVQREMNKKYVTARLANFLAEELRERDIIAQYGDHFVILLPEISADNVTEMAKRLDSSAKEKLGLQLSIGMSTFPEEVTFEKLVEHAESDLLQIIMEKRNQTESITTNGETVLQQREALIP